MLNIESESLIKADRHGFWGRGIVNVKSRLKVLK